MMRASSETIVVTDGGSLAGPILKRAKGGNAIPLPQMDAQNMQSENLPIAMEMAKNMRALYELPHDGPQTARENLDRI